MQPTANLIPPGWRLSAHILSLLYPAPVRAARLELRPTVIADTAPTISDPMHCIAAGQVPLLHTAGELLYSTAFTGTLHDFALSSGNVKAAA